MSNNTCIKCSSLKWHPCPRHAACITRCRYDPDQCELCLSHWGSTDQDNIQEELINFLQQCVYHKRKNGPRNKEWAEYCNIWVSVLHKLFSIIRTHSINVFNRRLSSSFSYTLLFYVFTDKRGVQRKVRGKIIEGLDASRKASR